MSPGSADPEFLDPDLGSTDPASLDPDLTDPVGSLVVLRQRWDLEGYKLGFLLRISV